MVKRIEYLRRLQEWKDDQVIKVVTGIRRCGKSTLLSQYQEYLLESGVKEKQIISINFEELEYEELTDYKKLYEYIKERLCKEKMTYIFLDEVQKVPSYEKVVDSLYAKKGADIYITGSNAYMLSGDLATLLTGRYVEISMLPLSFKEYCEQTGQTAERGFADYMKNGGMPYVAAMQKTDEKISTYLEGIYNTVIIKDIEDRQIRKEHDPLKRKITDIVLLKSIARFLSSTIGSPISVRSVTDYLVSSGRKVSANTVNDYMEALAEAFIFYPVERFDIAGKQLLKSNKKWYMVDLGLRNYVLPRKNYDLGFSIENIVYFELIRRNYRVNIGKYGNTEVDFVAQYHGGLTYYQVTADMTSESTFEREMRPLREIKDNYEKIVLTLERYTPGNYDGIKVINVIDWLSASKNES
ncbi:ATP-binding protein [Mediterraneibacter glycyrrhizinilyticus]|uniref:ATP-binding protein n=1 Tax=Mediterraneibacter glycyrrhizinilyticus TaxID=342942 RepID=UPI0025A31D6A|nr:ATP-binding protein [Mediterraneibacter glycyrrhizinilyticus]MDM8211434.1 ATP-binding protein [Mediterraneibacter glycyrrhizinilyticus]